MKLILKIERRGINTVDETTTETFEGESISIGRGAAAQIRFRDSQISAIQAIFELNAEGLIVREVGRSGLLSVNGKRVQLTTLNSGDQITIGVHSLSVGFSDGCWNMTVDASSFEERVDDQDLVRQQLKSLAIEHKLPSLLMISLWVVVLTSFLYFLVPVVSETKEAWNSGQISSAHKFIERDCQACHVEPFKSVQNSECTACHAVASHPHSDKPRAHPVAYTSQRCTECHIEHNGNQGIHLRDSRACVSCHGDIKRVAADSALMNVMSMNDHPSFRISVLVNKEVSRVEVESSVAVDSTPLKLNHAVHLTKNLRGPKGKVTLQCADCHASNKESQELQPVSYEKNCRSCHTLEFDPAYPGLEVPHGDQSRITEFLRSHYSQMILRPEEQVKIADSLRIKPGKKYEAQAYNRATSEKLEEMVSQAEELLYQKTGCQLCHLPKEPGAALLRNSRFDVAAPHIPDRWFPKASFKHHPHQHMACTECHGGALKSKDTKDVLLPQINSCRSCHADPGAKGKLDSDCSACHEYH